MFGSVKYSQYVCGSKNNHTVKNTDFDLITKKNKTALEYVLEQTSIVGVLNSLQYFTKNKPGKAMTDLIRLQVYHDHRESVNLHNIHHTCKMWLEDGEVWY